jgi:hypothetical protein
MVWALPASPRELIAVNLDVQLFSILEPSKNVNYGRADLPSTRDGQIRDLVLGVADNATFERAIRLMPRDADRVLSAFAERAASIAVRHQDVRELRAGLLAIALAQAITNDPRDPLAPLALLHRASEMIGSDPNSDFVAVNDLVEGRGGGLLDFLHRSPDDKAIAAMGYEEGDDKHGFRFIRNW